MLSARELIKLDDALKLADECWIEAYRVTELRLLVNEGKITNMKQVKEFLFCDSRFLVKLLEGYLS